MAKPNGPVDDAQIARAFRTLAEEHAALREPGEKQAAWNRLEYRALAGAVQRRRSASAGRWLVPALAAAVVLLFGAWLRQPALDFEVSGAVVKDGEIRTEAGPGLVAFTDGSRVEPSPSTALSVSIVGEHAALTRLSRGKLRVDVRHEKDTDWRFLAGPYEVQVVGTKFDLGWDPDASRLSIAMLEGRVRVTGPGRLNRLLAKGEVLEWPPVEAVAARAAVERSPAPIETEALEAPALAAPAPAVKGGAIATRSRKRRAPRPRATGTRWSRRVASKTWSPPRSSPASALPSRAAARRS
jgi:ferric-dicitrate binding protein FerR (iron transport regulator)